MLVLQGMRDLVDDHHENEAQDQGEANQCLWGGLRLLIVVVMMALGLVLLVHGTLVYVACRVNGSDSLWNNHSQRSAH